MHDRELAPAALSHHISSPRCPLFLVPCGHPWIGLSFKFPYALLVSPIQTTCSFWCILDYWSTDRPTNQPTNQPNPTNTNQTKPPTKRENRSWGQAFTAFYAASLVSFPSQMNPIHALPPQIIFKIHFSKPIILSSTPRSSTWSLSFRPSDQNHVCISASPDTCHMPRPSHRSCSDHQINTWWGERMKKLIITDCRPVSCYSSPNVRDHSHLLLDTYCCDTT
jgi:hypothetical protein